MKRKSQKTALILAFFLIFSLFLFPSVKSQDTQIVYGYIKYSNGTPVSSGVTVYVTNNNTGGYKIMTTTSYGTYTASVHGNTGDVLYVNISYAGNIGSNTIVLDDDAPSQNCSVTISGNNPPIANFDYTPLNPTTSDTIQFSDTSTDPENGTASSWNWNFGDGTESSQQNATHKYSRSSTYQVTLTVMDYYGAPNSISTYVIVESTSNGGDGDGDGGNPSNIRPTANANGPYYGFALQNIIFDGSESFDTDGEIVGYKWDFENDGVYDTSWMASPTTTYSYSEAGNYIVKLAVIDNIGSSNTDTSTVMVNESPIKTMSNETIDEINTQYNLLLEEPCYANDTDHDGILDTFIDPNEKLTLTKATIIDEAPVFLLSTNKDDIPEFFWDAEADKILQVSYITGNITDTQINPEENTITITVTIEKDNWAYIKIEDPYPEFPMTIKTIENKTIPLGKQWRENNAIYILDNQSAQYQIIYTYTILDPTMTPQPGTTFDTQKPTIIIAYNEPVTLLKATLNNMTINLTTSDNKTYEYIPQVELEETTYILSITVEDKEKNTKTSSATYSISIPKSTEKSISIDFVSTPLFILLVIIITITITIAIIAKKKYL